LPSNCVRDMQKNKYNTMRRILISGYHGFNNIGDEAILESILQVFRKAASKEGQTLAITVLSANPEAIRQRNGIRAVSRTNLFAIIRAIKDCDLFLSGGGSLLQDKTGYGLSVLYYLGLVFLARLFRKKTVLYAHGIGPITKKINRFIARWIIDGVDLVTVRDVDSRDELISLGVKKPPLHVTVDPAFCFVPSRENNNVRVGRILDNLPSGKPFLGISVRGWLGLNKLFIPEIAKVADQLALEIGAVVIIIPMFPAKDLAVSRCTASLIQQEVFVVEEELTPQEALSLFTYLDLLIGVRLHSLIFAAITGTPMVGVGYDPKVSSLLVQLGLSPAFRVENLQAEELYHHCLKIWQQRETIRTELQQIAADYRRQSRSFGENVYRYFFGKEENGGIFQ
jgi:polysaccharide pyruvyl transferase CsaB